IPSALRPAAILAPRFDELLCLPFPLAAFAFMFRCLWFKSWHEPRSGLRANHFSNNLPNGIASGIGPGLHQCSHRKTKGTVLSNGLYKSTTALSVLASAEGSAGRHCNTDATLMQSSFPSTDGASQVGCFSGT